MEAPAVLMVHPMSSYLERELASRFNLFKLWEYPSRHEFLTFATGHKISIRGVICCAGVGADAEFIETLPDLEIVSTYSVGVDKIDLAKCREKEVRVTNTPDVLTDDVADLAIGLGLAVLRRICGADQFVRGGKWKSGGDPGLAVKFSGKSVGILGLGRIGLAIAKRAESFGCPISYTSRSPKPHNTYKYFKSVIDLASNSDILFVSCSLTPETHHIITRQVLDALGSTGVLVNIGRGAHINEPELVSALVDGRLGGAGLDVFENEPDVPEKLLELVENVVVLSHVGSDTVETCKDMADLVVKNLEAHFQNLPLLTPVD